VSDIHDTDRRVAVLERIAQDTATALADIRAELRGLRTDFHSDIQQLRGETIAEARSMRADLSAEIRLLRGDFRWLLRLMIAGFVGTWALLAHGLHWF
jgi:hypothetical protein